MTNQEIEELKESHSENLRKLSAAKVQLGQWDARIVELEAEVERLREVANKNITLAIMLLRGTSPLDDI